MRGLVGYWVSSVKENGEVVPFCGDTQSFKELLLNLTIRTDQSTPTKAQFPQLTAVGGDRILTFSFVNCVRANGENEEENSKSGETKPHAFPRHTHCRILPIPLRTLLSA